MELRLLKYFLMVAQEENFTRAAEKLHKNGVAETRDFSHERSHAFPPFNLKY